MDSSTKKFLITFLGITVIVLAVVFYLTFKPSDQKINQNTQVSENNIGTPLHLSIPKINVAANIEAAGLALDGTVAVPDGPEGVTWYKDGAKPGEMGSAVVTGHYGPWRSGEGSVFDDLNTLEIGDMVYIKDSNGKTLTFKVINKKTYKLDETVPEVFIKDDSSYLNLITCSGDWLKNQGTFTDRLVVFTELVD